MSNYLELLNRAAAQFNEYAPQGLPLPLTAKSPLANQGTVLDSLSLMNFIMEVELQMEETGKAVNLTDGQALSNFGTAGDLAAYLENLGD